MYLWKLHTDVWNIIVCVETDRREARDDRGRELSLKAGAGRGPQRRLPANSSEAVVPTLAVFSAYPRDSPRHPRTRAKPVIRVMRPRSIATLEDKNVCANQGWRGLAKRPCPPTRSNVDSFPFLQPPSEYNFISPFFLLFSLSCQNYANKWNLTENSLGEGNNDILYIEIYSIFEFFLILRFLIGSNFDSDNFT